MEALRRSSKVVVVEGFDMVGKTFFMKEHLSQYKIFHADHELTDATVGRNNSWTIGYGIFDLMSQTGLNVSDPIVIDRCVASSFVYSKLFPDGGVSKESMDQIVDWYSKCKVFKEDVVHVHVCHYNRCTARKIYEASQHREKNPNPLSAELDKYSSFDEYWSAYKLAECWFESVYSQLGIEPVKAKVYPGGYFFEFPGSDHLVNIRNRVKEDVE